MNKSKLYIFTALVLAFALCAGLFSGCSVNVSPSPTPSAAEATQTQLAGDTTAAPATPADSAAAAPTSAPAADGDVTVAPAALGDLTVSPLSDTDNGVLPGSKFLLTSASQITANDLSSRVSVRENGAAMPQGAGLFTFAAGDNANEYVLSFDQPLDAGAVYNLVYTENNKAPLSYAFQTADSFAVTGTTPGLWAYGVPIDSGIEIDLNREPAADYANYITIDPPVAGKFQQSGAKIVFVPVSLKPNTAYTVIVSKDLQSADGETLAADYAVKFNTESPDNAEYFDVDGDARLSFIPDDGVYFHIFATPDLAGGDFDVTVYKIDTASDFISADTDKPPQDAEVVSTFTARLMPDDNGYYSDMYYLVAPNAPDPGYYYYQIHTAYNVIDYTVGQLVQISNLSVYSAAMNGQEVFWVNDASTGEPAEGANITAGMVTAATGADGTAQIAIDANGYIPGAAYSMPAAPAGGGVPNSNSVTIDYAGYPTFVYTQQTFDKQDLTASQKYYSYIYTDRSAYKKTDTVDVFGVIKPMKAAYALTASDTLEFRLGDMIKLPITPDKYGTFSLEIPVQGMFGYVEGGIYLNGELVQSRGMYFLDYNRDSYVLDGSLDKYTYAPGETASAQLSVTTFDGAPVEGVSLKEQNNLANATTDASGAAVCQLPVQANQYYSGCDPIAMDFSFGVYGSENYAQYISLPYYLIQSDVLLDYTVKSPGVVDFTANKLDRAALEKYASQSMGTSYNLDESVYKGAAANLNFSLYITKNTYVATLTGTYYDFIQKRSVDKYDYNLQTEDYQTIDAQLKNGALELTGLPVSDYSAGVYYTATARYTDTAGRGVSVEIPLSSYVYNPVSSSPATRSYYFMSKRANDTDYMSYGTNLSVGETGSIRMGYDGMAPDENLPGKMLTIVTRDTVLDTSVGDPNGSPLTFNEGWISNVVVYGAYFDGKHMYAVRNPMGIYYDSTERGLNFDVTFDKDKYDPGDEVTATVKVTDVNGNPKQAMVNMSVVDEAVFGPNPNDASFLSSLYWSVYYSGGSNYYSTFSLGSYIYSSYSQTNETSNSINGGAEKGGGGGDYSVRSDFTDNPGFVTQETDADGLATIKFKLSDGITSWRVTTQAITTDNFAGNAKSNVVTTMPYYLNLVMPDTYIAGDEVGVLAKSLGTDYRLNQTDTTYKIEVDKAGGDGAGGGVYSDTQTSKSFAQWNCGKLPEGDYTVTVYADYGGGNTDAMQKTFSVVKDPVTLRLTSKQYLSPQVMDSARTSLAPIDITGSPVTLTFMNGDMRDIMGILYSCVDYNSYRTDYMAATAFAGYFTDSLRRSAPPDYAGSMASQIPATNNGTSIAEVAYGDGDPVYTALFAAAFPEIAKPLLTGVDKNIVNPGYYAANGDLDAAASYLTLAALGYNVLLDVRSQISAMESEADQSVYENSYDSRMKMLFYAAALCCLGDDAGAAALMDKYPESPDLTTSLNVGSSGALSDAQTKREYLDTMYLYINTTIDPQKAYQYLLDKADNSFVSDVCEKVNFIKKCVPLGGLTSEIQYSIDGQVSDVQLTNFQTRTISVTKEQYAGLNLKLVSGNTSVWTSYYGGADNLDSALKTITVNKTITESDTPGIYNINFTVTIPKGANPVYYTLIDRVPSNMTYLSPGAANDGDVWIYSPEKQIVNAGLRGYEDPTASLNGERT
ncbi:MAG: Ig-like domain-containing protein, partial [Defluviitaleaceae bacterium]|nr:Ig-like domain-containing protein [Defluviitaleaceae bacterium]